jgi:hypothetical protein
VKQLFEEIAARSDFSFETLEVDQYSLLGEERTSYFTIGHGAQIETRIDHSALAKA